jgi:hypothetical protein
MKFRKKPVVIEAITFAELVQYGREHSNNVHNGMAWSFEYKGQPITHENDQCYLIPTKEGVMYFTPDDMLITGVQGEIYPCKIDIFNATYEPADDLCRGPTIKPTPASSVSDLEIEQEIVAKGKTAPRITPDDIEANITSEVYFSAADGMSSENGFVAGIKSDADLEVVNAALNLMTFCVITLRNGFTVTGESACASPENFDAEIGRKIARQNAVQKIWPLMGYALKCELAEQERVAGLSFVDRMQIELGELQQRLEKLDVFLTSSAFRSLGSESAELLREQLAAMMEYEKFLKQRIELAQSGEGWR